MRTCSLLFLAGAVVCLGAACQPQPAFKTTSTIREIMDAMVMPPADVLWGAVSISVSDKGVEENGPKTDEEWTKVRRQAVMIAEASDLILMTGRHVAKPGEKSKEPKAQLEPDQIDALINKDREGWTKFAHGMHDAAMVAVKAIDDRKLQALSAAGDGLNESCETCHKKYWYPNEGKDAEPAAQKK